jgi:aspartyl-tRNA(Asn)/glutamyl-tRNA(Gln) amidotransferase subunit B
VRRARFIDQHKLSEYDAALLTRSRDTADYFEQCVQQGGDPKIVANWINGELAATLNRESVGISQGPVSAGSLAEILRVLKDGTISARARKSCSTSWSAPGKPAGNAGATPGEPGGAAARRRDHRREGAAADLRLRRHRKSVDDVLAANAAQVADYKSGKAKAFNSLVGQVMKATQGKANPAQVNELLKKKLDG